MSRQAIAAALARQDLTRGERLVAFSLASFAGRDGRAWPGAAAAAARAGLSRSRYLHDRDRLVRRGLVDVEEKASGRGRASTVALRFVAEGPWWEGEINPELFEAVLSRTHMRGAARLLLAAMAALSDADGVLRGLSNEELRAAAGLEDRTYRRTRPDLVASEELVLLSGARGRGNTNVWQVRASAQAPAHCPIGPSRRRVAPLTGARPLLASVASNADAGGVDDVVIRASPGAHQSVAASAGEGPVLPGVSDGKGGQNRTVSALNCPVWSGVSPVNDGQDRTLFELPAPENPAENPAESRQPTRAREGTPEPQNRGPPQPPCRGELASLIDRRADLRHRPRAATAADGPCRPRRGPSRPRRAHGGRAGRLAADPRAARGGRRREHIRDLARVTHPDRDRGRGRAEARCGGASGDGVVDAGAVRAAPWELWRPGWPRAAVRHRAGGPRARPYRASSQATKTGGSRMIVAITNQKGGVFRR